MLTPTKPLTKVASGLLVLCFLLSSACATGPKKIVDDEAGLSQWQKANKRLKRGKFEKALVLLDEIITLEAGFAAAHINRGIALAGLKRNSEALAALETGLKLRPKNPRTIAAAYNQAGMLYRSNQQLDAARKSYEKALRADPSFDLAPFNLALLYDQALDQPEKALSFYQQYQQLQESPDPAVAVWMRILEIDRLGRGTEKAPSSEEQD